MYRKSTMQLIALLFYVAIISYMIGSCFEFTVWANDIRLFTAIMKNVSYVLMVPCILDAVQWTLNNFNKKMIKYLLMLGVFLIYMIFFHVNAAFVCFGFSFAALRIDKEQLIDILKYVLIALLITVIVLGIFNGNVQARVWGNTRNRYSFGFTDSYSMQMIWMSIVSCIILDKRRTSIYKLAFMLFVTMVLNAFGDTRTAFIATIFLLVMNHIMQNIKISFKRSKGKKKHSFFRYLFVLCFGFFNGICWINYKYTSAVALALDGIFTGRISTTTRFIRYVCGGSISLFPTVVEDNFDLSVAALKSFALDSSYAQMLFWYGILFSIIVLILLEKFMSVAIKKDNVKLIAILSAVALNGMLQPTVLSLIYNPTIILAIGMIFNSFIERERQNGNN